MLEYVKIKSLRVNDKLGRDLYDAKGMILARTGTVVSENMLKAIKAQGFKGVYINRTYGSLDRDMVHIQEPIIDDLTVIKIINLIKQIFNNKRIWTNAWDNSFTKDRKELENFIDEIYLLMNKLNLSNALILEMDDNRSKDNWLEYHSFNTMLISMCIGLRLGFTEKQCKALALGGLFHDLGKMKTPELKDKKDITKEEKDILRKHPREVFDLLTQLPEPFGYMPCTYGCWQSHELYDGTGYPLMLSGAKATDFGYIVGIASRFDNATHACPYDEEPMDNEDALEMIMGSGKYPANVAKALTEVVSVYPIGVKVKLSNNEEAIVIKNNIGLPLRPLIKVGYHEVDLATDTNYRNVTILRVIED